VKLTCQIIAGLLLLYWPMGAMFTPMAFAAGSSTHKSILPMVGVMLFYPVSDSWQSRSRSISARRSPASGIHSAGGGGATAQGPQSIAFGWIENLNGIERLPVTCEKWVRPGFATQTYAKHARQRANHHPNRKALGLRRQRASRMFAERRAARRTERCVRRRWSAGEGVNEDTNKGDRWSQRVAHRGVATARVPTVQAIAAQPHGANLLVTALETQA